MRREFNDKKKRTLFSQMLSLLKAGISFTRTFDIIIEGADQSDRDIISEIFNRVVAGEGLWFVLKESGEFTHLDYGVIRIGEETGRLVESLTFLVDYYHKKESRRRILINALSYPAITLCIAVIVLMFMLTVIVPMFQQVYSRMGGQLPSVTQWLISISKTVPVIFAFLGVIIVLAFLAGHIWRDTYLYRRMYSQFLLGFPFIGKFVRKYQVSRFCTLMFILISSNVPILQALDFMIDIINIYPFSESIKAMRSNIENGATFADEMKKHQDLFGKKLAILLKVGEETNSIGSMLHSYSEDSSAELEFEIRQMNNIIEPVLILFIGVIVAFVLIAMYMPMFRLGMTIG